MPHTVKRNMGLNEPAVHDNLSQRLEKLQAELSFYILKQAEKESKSTSFMILSLEQGQNAKETRGQQGTEGSDECRPWSLGIDFAVQTF